MPSIRFFSRGRTEAQRKSAAKQRGFVLVIALVLAILYFMLMGLVMIDSSRAQAEAQRYRARVVAATLAENAAELACVQMVSSASGMINKEDAQGTMMGSYQRTGLVSGGAYEKFEVHGEATTKGVIHQTANVFLEGHLEGNVVRIDFSRHSQ